MMNDARNQGFLTVPRLDKIPFLIHGFGTKFWKRRDFKSNPEWKKFNLIFLNQIHSDVVHVLDRIPYSALKGDAMITDLSNVFLIIRTADCLPVFIVDEKKKVIAAAHAGWKGTQKKVAQKVIQTMIDRYGCEPSSLLAALGPCISSGCYEVGEDVRQSFEQGGPSQDFFRKHPAQNDRYYLDLRAFNLSQMTALGVKEQNVFSIPLCTHCHEDLLSYRRNRNRTGRMLSFIGLIKKAPLDIAKKCAFPFLLLFQFIFFIL